MKTLATRSASEAQKATKVIDITCRSSTWEYIAQCFPWAGTICEMSMKVASDYAVAGHGPREVDGPRNQVRQSASDRGPTPPVRSRKPRAKDGLGWRSPHAVVGCFCVLAILIGWNARGETGLSPTDGLGYGLGIIGLSMMVALLGYSVRKRARSLRHAGSMRTWFEAHLVLGLLGPTAILYHSDFSLGSANSTISLACVLAVSGSGIGGRFLYGRMHRGLAGSRRTVSNARKLARNILTPIEDILDRNLPARRLLAEFESLAAQEPRFPFRMLHAVWMRMHAGRTKRRILGEVQELDLPAHDADWTRRAVAQNLAEQCRAGELRLFERLFALWHAIHIPLTIILFASAVIHVVAVHLY